MTDTNAKTIKPRIQNLAERSIDYWPGIALSALVAFTALFLSEHYGGPAFLFALLIGMSLNCVRETKLFASGINITAKIFLRVGVALLGLRIGMEEIATLGGPSILIILSGIVLTILVALAITRLFNLSNYLGVLVGGATAICGASAALAISSCLPKYKDRERDTLFTVVIVTALSTVAMVLYPILTTYLNFNAQDAGFFIGATIHDVAQVVGAGYSVSQDAGDIAVLTKLLRVAALVPTVFLFAIIFASAAKKENPGQKIILLPAFLIAFVVFVILNSVGAVPQIITETGSHLSRFLLIMAVAAIGVKTYFGDLADIGWQALVISILTTVFLAVFISVLLII